MNVDDRPRVQRAIRSARLIGRADELMWFDRALERAAKGTPSTVLLGGDAGIGKTRLVDEWGRRAREADARMLLGHCLEMSAAALPYAPVIDALRRLVAATPAARRAEWFGPSTAYGEVTPLIRELDGQRPRHESVELQPIDSRQTRLFEQLVGLLERAAARLPIVLAVEDLHWADQSTLDLVGYMASTIRDAGVVLVLTYRSDELTRRHPLRPLLARLTRDPAVARTALSPLARVEVAELAEAIRGEPPPTALIDEIHTRSEGNPFFAEELLAATDDDATLPPALHDALLARVDRLSEDAQTVVRVAAATGRDVDHELLEVVTGAYAGVTGTRLLQALRDAVAGHVLVVGGEGVGYAFRHALLQEAVHADLLPGERVRLHALVADALAERPELAAPADATAALAWHYAASHDQPRALAASVAAAESATRAVAHADALRHLERALEVWDGVPDADQRAGRTRDEVLVWAASAARLHHDIDRAIAYACQAIATIDERAAPARAAEAWMLLGRARFDDGRDGAFEALRRAVGLVPAEPTVERARVLAADANALMLVPRSTEALAPATEALAVARRVGATSEELYALVTLASVTVNLGDDDRGLALFGEAHALAEREGMLDTGKIYVNHGDALFGMGRADEALDLTRRGLVWAERHGVLRSFSGWLHANLAEFLIGLGRLAEAAESLEAGRAVREADDIRLRFQAARIALARGQLDLAEYTLPDAVRTPHGMSGGAQFVAPRGEFDAEHALARGDAERALQVVAATLNEVERADGVRRYGGALYALGVRAAATLDGDDAARWIDGLRARLAAARTDAPYGVAPLWAAETAMADAEVATWHGDADVDAAWETAVDAFAALGMVPGATRARIRWATALLPGDRDRAARLLRGAWHDATGHDLRLLAADAQRLGRRANLTLGDPGDQPAAPFGLTAREQEVLRLVAAGRTNPQIGDELFISRKTASTHVSNILAKLEVDSRGEAAAVAHRLGLAGA